MCIKGSKYIRSEEKTSIRSVGQRAIDPLINDTQAGGFLDLRFVRVRQGAGIVRARYGLEEGESPPGSKVLEIRGGAVAIERGALGGAFLGVTFIAVSNTPEAVQAAIAATVEGTGGRVYGGHVFVAEGDVQFVACNFWDTTLVLPLTDQVGGGGWRRDDRATHAKKLIHLLFFSMDRSSSAATSWWWAAPAASPPARLP